MSVGVTPPVLKPLKLSCTNSDCENDRHCFLQKTQKPRPHGGPCRHCGKALVDFAKVQSRSLADVESTFSALGSEWIRHEFWERPFDQRAINHAKRKGKRAMIDVEAAKRIRQSVGKPRHPREGKQTPYEGNVLFYAQHSVAACCRRCVEYWHGIPGGAPLSEESIQYLSALVVRYIEKRLPDLNDQPMKVPPIRRARAEQVIHG
ncbi:MAG: DUF4186 family protein [Pseudomonadota bacterium]